MNTIIQSFELGAKHVAMFFGYVAGVVTTVLVACLVLTGLARLFKNPSNTEVQHKSVTPAPSPVKESPRKQSSRMHN